MSNQARQEEKERQKEEEEEMSTQVYIYIIKSKMKITSDTTILITGGAQGLGLTTVEYLIKIFKCQICVLDINQDALKNLQKKYPKILCIKCDISKEDEVELAV